MSIDSSFSILKYGITPIKNKAAGRQDFINHHWHESANG